MKTLRELYPIVFWFIIIASGMTSTSFLTCPDPEGVHTTFLSRLEWTAGCITIFFLVCGVGAFLSGHFKSRP